jgi:hypothetical protein
VEIEPIVAFIDNVTFYPISEPTPVALLGHSDTNTDTDSGGVKDCIDADDDNDGLSDEDEISFSTDPLTPDTDDGHGAASVTGKYLYLLFHSFLLLTFCYG